MWSLWIKNVTVNRDVKKKKKKAPKMFACIKIMKVDNPNRVIYCYNSFIIVFFYFNSAHYFILLLQIKWLFVHPRKDVWTFEGLAWLKGQMMWLLHFSFGLKRDYYIRIQMCRMLNGYVMLVFFLIWQRQWFVFAQSCFYSLLTPDWSQHDAHLNTIRRARRHRLTQICSGICRIA